MLVWHHLGSLLPVMWGNPWCGELETSEAAVSSLLLKGNSKQAQLQSPCLPNREDAAALEAAGLPRILTKDPSAYPAEN